ncbi:hypothetical protein E2C01_091642 [Portunus trituberculatus]|uniref:Uncharacterized protein n=1 Tax=Portunus trituberculatus TaxID=210409 RepID=A0A5B7JPM2_PORTR|nr:hypothetical protein [Portunus trituberculatus]
MLFFLSSFHSLLIPHFVFSLSAFISYSLSLSLSFSLSLSLSHFPPAGVSNHSFPLRARLRGGNGREEMEVRRHGGKNRKVRRKGGGQK